MGGRFNDAIADLLARRAGPPRRQVPVPAITRAVAGLPDGSGDLKPAKDFDAVSDRLADALSRGQRLTPRQARDGAWCLWTTRTALAARPETLDPFLAQLRALRHKGASRALALSYLVSFHEDRPGLSAVAAAIRDLAGVAGAPFDALQDRLSVFDPVQGPKEIGDAALAARVSPREILMRQGMVMELVLGGGLVEPCARRVLERAAEDIRLTVDDRIALIRTIAVKEDSTTLNFAQHKALVSDALLLPYAAGSIDKPARDRILNFLIALQGFGDPRTQPGNWISMPRASAIAIKWLTDQALRQYLDVVGAVNPNENWRHRRRFWEAVHAALDGQVSIEAWVVLDPDGSSEAMRRFGRNSRFARFAGAGVQTGHAVMLMRIGRGVCAEWSFSGKCRFWLDAERPGAPRLYQPSYDADFLRSGRNYAPALEITHNPHTGPNAWQHKAARQIETMTGVRLSPKDYML